MKGQINDKQLRHFIAAMPFTIKAYRYYLQIFKHIQDDNEVEQEVSNFRKGIKRYVTFVSSFYKAQSKE